MRATIKDGGPAFPYGENKVTERYSEGMTLRDYFAAAALQGVISCEQVQHATFQAYARIAYRLADAMLAQRTKKEAQP